MPNPAYRKGARAERIVKADLEARGYHTVRRYASKGPYDLLAVPSGPGQPFMVEVKAGTGRMTVQERKDLAALGDQFRCVPLLAHYHQGVISWSVIMSDGSFGPMVL